MSTQLDGLFKKINVSSIGSPNLLFDDSAPATIFGSNPIMITNIPDLNLNANNSGLILNSNNRLRDNIVQIDEVPKIRPAVSSTSKQESVDKAGFSKQTQQEYSSWKQLFLGDLKSRKQTFDFIVSILSLAVIFILGLTAVFVLKANGNGVSAIVAIAAFVIINLMTTYLTNTSLVGHMANLCLVWKMKNKRKS